MRRPARRGVRVPEKAVQQQIVTLLRTVGCAVSVLGTRRPRGEYQGTCQSPGLPDVWAWLPRGIGGLWVEVKAEGGRLRPAQAAFRDAAVAAIAAADAAGAPKVGRVWYVTGGLDAVIAALIGLGLLTAGQVAHYRVPSSVAPDGETAGTEGTA